MPSCHSFCKLYARSTAAQRKVTRVHVLYANGLMNISRRASVEPSLAELAPVFPSPATALGTLNKLTDGATLYLL